MPSLLERQVSALRESVRPGGRWDRLASGEMKPGERLEPDPLCDVSPCDDCPLSAADQKCWGTGEDAFARWDSAVDAARAGVDGGVPWHEIYNSPPVVALAREMRALLRRLLVEYEARLDAERTAAATDTSGDAIDDDWTCPHCGGSAGTWFDRVVGEDGRMANVCEDCGKNVGKPPEHYARAVALGEAHAALLAALEEMSDVGAERTPLVTRAYQAWKEVRDADN